jgi:dienelactone hydrolase
MCHYASPAGQPPAHAVREEVAIPLPGGERLPALLARPEQGDGPPVLIASDIFGRSPFYEDLAARLADAGYTALLPEYFFRLAPLPERNLPLAYARRNQLDEHRVLDELGVALDWLSARVGKPAGRIGTIGFCLGGTLVLDLAAARADLATVCYYGFPAATEYDTALAATPPLDLTDRMQGPILGFWGDQDAAVGMPNVERLAAALRGRGVAYDQVIYPGVGHAFLAATPDAPDPAPYQAARDAWQRTLAFYATHLRA